ncbi:hypothetical protein D3C73_1051070 [compost metagenome]
MLFVDRTPRRIKFIINNVGLQSSGNEAQIISHHVMLGIPYQQPLPLLHFPPEGILFTCCGVHPVMGMHTEE